MDSMMSIRNRILMNTPHLETASGSIASFKTDVSAKLKECKVYFEPKQEGSGTPSPDNVRNVVGWDGVTVKQSDFICLFQTASATSGRTTGTDNSERELTNAYGTTINTTVVDGLNTELVVTQSIADASRERYQNGYMSIFPDWNALTIGESYLFMADVEITSNPLNMKLEMMMSDKYLYRQEVNVVNGKVTMPFVWDISSNYNNPFIEFYCNGCSWKMSNMCIVKSTPSETAVSWSSGIGTVYGGYIDLATGDLVSEWGYKRFTGAADETWIKSGDSQSWSKNVFVIPYPDIRKVQYQSEGDFILSNMAQWGISIYNSYRDPEIENGINVNNGYANVAYHPPLADVTVEEFRTWLAEHPLEVCAKLVTPITYHLTPQQIRTFLGVNNIWVEHGDVEATHWVGGLMKNYPTRRKVVWNQMAEPLTDEYWGSYEIDCTSAVFEDEVATVTWLKESSGYHATIRQYTPPPVTKDDVLYFSYEVYPSKTGDFSLEWANNQIPAPITCQANTWTRISFRNTVPTTGTYRTYIVNLRSSASNTKDMVVKARNPIYINLTKMFGAGNEPSLAEFEEQCQKNGIDLNTYHPVDAGMPRWWIM